MNYCAWRRVFGCKRLISLYTTVSIGLAALLLSYYIFVVQVFTLLLL